MQDSCSRSQPGIKVIIRGLWGHLLHTVRFLVLPALAACGEGIQFSVCHSVCQSVPVFSSPGQSPGRAIVLPPPVDVGIGGGIGVSEKFNDKVFM